MELIFEEERTFLNRLHATLPSDVPVDLTQASDGHYTRLIDIADAMTNGSRPKTELAQETHALKTDAHQNMQLVAPTALWAWRLLYADACVLYCITILNSSTARESIGILDQAIIIVGGGDDDRLDLILSLIGKVQQKFLPPSTHSGKLLYKGHHSSPGSLFTARREVPTVQSSLSFLSFQKTHSTSPFVIRNYARDWPALKPDTWNSIDYLLSISGPSRMVPVEVGHDYRDESWNQVLMEWETFLHAFDDTTGRSKASQEGLYLAQYNILRQFPALRNDIVVPDYTYCSLNPPDFPGYKAPDNPEGAILNVWLGPQGAMSPAHFDPYYNLYAQIVGYKRVWLSPPRSTPYMEGYSPVKRSSEDSSVSSLGDSNSSNTSRVDVFSGENVMTDFLAFSENVIPEAMSVILGPGDLLFFPPGWWHGMRSESTSLSVSMWF